MKISFFNIMFTVFYFSFLFISVWYITQFNWGELSTIEVIEKVGVLGGLMCLGDFFKKEMKEESQKNQEVKK